MIWSWSLKDVHLGLWVVNFEILCNLKNVISFLFRMSLDYHVIGIIGELSFCILCGKISNLSQICNNDEIILRRSIIFSLGKSTKFKFLIYSVVYIYLFIFKILC